MEATNEQDVVYVTNTMAGEPLVITVEPSPGPIIMTNFEFIDGQLVYVGDRMGRAFGSSVVLEPVVLPILKKGMNAGETTPEKPKQKNRMEFLDGLQPHKRKHR